MHFEILVEDQSGKKVLDILVPKIIGKNNSYRILFYKGIGHIAKGLKSCSDANKRILLDQLPRLLRGYGKSSRDYQVAVFIVCDLDDKCLKDFRQQLITILDRTEPKPEARFCIAVEEGEAWLLGDIKAITTAYPKAKMATLKKYQNDSICGTWEVLADAIVTGGTQSLLRKGYQTIGKAKSEWAENIAPHMNIDNNKSPSFNYFKRKLQELSQEIQSTN